MDTRLVLAYVVSRPYVIFISLKIQHSCTHSSRWIVCALNCMYICEFLSTYCLVITYAILVILIMTVAHCKTGTVATILRKTLYWFSCIFLKVYCLYWIFIKYCPRAPVWQQVQGGIGSDNGLAPNKRSICVIKPNIYFHNQIKCVFIFLNNWAYFTACPQKSTANVWLLVWLGLVNSAMSK